MSERVNETENNAYHSTGATFVGNPRYTGPNEPIEEKPGQITSDSLAAESLSNDGGFASNQPGTSASSQPSGGYTGNTTDTSGATVIPPASSRARRDDEETYMSSSGSGSGVQERSGDRYETQAYRTSREDYTDNTPARNADMSSGDYNSNNTSSNDNSYNTSSGSGSGSTSYASAVDNAPSTYSSSGASNENIKPKPKGQNITEGGFDSDAPNASFNNDIGGQNDPGRVAEQQMARSGAMEGVDAGRPGANQRMEDGNDKGGFERLGDDVEA